MRTAQGWLLALLCTSALPTKAQTVEFIHTDVLGTPVAVTDINRNLIERSEYEPYGGRLSSSTPSANQDGPGYTSHVMDAATGLTYMQQRYFDAGIGRFLSVDPVTAEGNTGANFNRYKYAANNPYRFTDPDGRRDWESLSAHSSNFTSAGTGFVGGPPSMRSGDAAPRSGKSAGATTQGTVHRASTQSEGQGFGSYGPLHTPICNTAMSGCSAQSVYDIGLKALPGPGGDGKPIQNGAISQLFVGPTQHFFDDKNLTVRNVALSGHALSGVVTRQVVMDGGGWVYIETSKVGPVTPANVAARIFDASLWRDVDLRIQRLVHRQAGE